VVGRLDICEEVDICEEEEQKDRATAGTPAFRLTGVTAKLDEEPSLAADR